MQTIEILPDVLTLLFAHPDITIPHLLKFEQVSKHWLSLIRSNHVQIWKVKINTGFPNGCFPTLYGQENWRDIAKVWWAWRRPWDEMRKLEQAETADVQELGVGETILRTDGGYIRDVTDELSNGEAHGIDTFGVRPDGQIIIADFVKLRKGVYEKPRPYIDIIFTETKATARPITNIARIRHKITDLIVRNAKNVYSFEGWTTGTRKKTITSLNTPGEFIFEESLCGSQVVFRRKEVQQNRQWHIILDSYSIQPPCNQTEFTVRTHPNGHFASNHSLLATTASHQQVDETAERGGKTFPHTIALLRLHDSKPLSKIAIGTSSQIVNLRLTRFNMLAFTRGGECLVFDLNLHLLHTIQLRTDVLLGHMMEDVDDRMVFTKCEGGIGDVAEWDPKRGTLKGYSNRFRKGVMPTGDGLEFMEFLGLMGDHDVNSGSGYYFTTMEYPVDEAGNRTGASGVGRIYWRWVKDGR
ncbi:hypothetical protein HDV00_005207 [Rhizophlyctis rosea]|nr:hypothetical protein HDV00_005207 [Rhizophlyctis rosea]